MEYNTDREINCVQRSNPTALTKFINSQGIKQEDVVSIVFEGDNFVLFYYK